MNREEKVRELLLLRELKIRKARESLWEYAKLMNPSFYVEGRWHLKYLCDTMQALYEGKLLKEDGTPYKKLILSIPP